jgi:hypothetical protein|tara:strand:- start:205 stop:453 length:249 start_codon:yes stop_codon:yes gene_type:complete
MSEDKVKVSKCEWGYKWIKYFFYGAMLFCIFVAQEQIESRGLNLVEVVQETAFTNALLFGCFGCLTDLSYRLRMHRFFDPHD